MNVILMTYLLDKTKYSWIPLSELVFHFYSYSLPIGTQQSYYFLLLL